MATIEDIIREFKQEAGIEETQASPPTEVSLTSTQREILTNAGGHPQGRLEGRLVGPNRAQTMDASDALVLVGKGLMSQESGRLGRVEFYITDAGRQAIAPVVEAEDKKDVKVDQFTKQFKLSDDKAKKFKAWLEEKGEDVESAQPFGKWMGLYQKFGAKDKKKEEGWHTREAWGVEWSRTTVGSDLFGQLQAQGLPISEIFSELKRRIEIRLENVDEEDGYGDVWTQLDGGPWVNEGRYRLSPSLATRRTYEATPPPDELVTMLKDKGFDAREEGLDVIVSLDRPISTSEVVDALDGQIDDSDVRKKGDSVVITTSMEAARPVRASEAPPVKYKDKILFRDKWGAGDWVAGTVVQALPSMNRLHFMSDVDGHGHLIGLNTYGVDWKFLGRQPSLLARRPVRASASWPTSAQVEQARQFVSVLANQRYALDSRCPSAEYDPTVRDLGLLKSFLEDHAKELGNYGQSAVLKSIEQCIDTLLRALDWPTAETPQRFVYRATLPPRGRRPVQEQAAEAARLLVTARESIPTMHDRVEWSLSIEPRGQTPQAVAFILDIDAVEAKAIMDSLVTRGEVVEEGGRYKLRAARPGRRVHAREGRMTIRDYFTQYAGQTHNYRAKRGAWPDWVITSVEFDGGDNYWVQFANGKTDTLPGHVEVETLFEAARPIHAHGRPVQESLVWTQAPGGFRADLPGGKVSLVVSREGDGTWRYTIHVIEDGHWIDPIVSDSEFLDAESAKAAAVSSITTGFLAARPIHAHGQPVQESVAWQQTIGGWKADCYPTSSMTLIVSRMPNGEWRYEVFGIEGGGLFLDPTYFAEGFTDEESAKIAAETRAKRAGLLAAHPVRARGRRTQIQEQYDSNAMRLHGWMEQAGLSPDEQEQFGVWIRGLAAYNPGWTQSAGEWQKWFDQFKQYQVVSAAKGYLARRALGEEMKVDTSKPYSVVSSETQISVQNFATEKEAEDHAEWMTRYHREKYEVVKIDWSKEARADTLTIEQLVNLPLNTVEQYLHDGIISQELYDQYYDMWLNNTFRYGDYGQQASRRSRSRASQPRL